MRYYIIINRTPEKELQRMDKKIALKIMDTIKLLSEHPFPSSSKKLVNFRGWEYYRIRIWDFRVVYEVRNETVTITIIEIWHRWSVYK